MARTKVSSRYQIVIPRDIRASLDIRPGQELQVIAKSGVITLVPDKPLGSLRGLCEA